MPTSLYSELNDKRHCVSSWKICCYSALLVPPAALFSITNPFETPVTCSNIGNERAKSLRINENHQVAGGEIHKDPRGSKAAISC